MYIRINPNPGGSWITWLLLLPLIVVAAMFGLVVLVVALAFVTLGVIAVMVRLWWLRRQLQRQARRSGALEGEYLIVREESRRDDQLR
jgi:hypothetical protein